MLYPYVEKYMTPNHHKICTDGTVRRPQMRLVLRSLALVLVVTLVTAGPLASQGSQGSSGADIVFGTRRQSEGVGTSIQFGEVKRRPQGRRE